MTVAPTFSQIKAQVAAIRKKVDGARFIGIRALGKWTGERTKRDGDQVFIIDQCDSPLEIRIALREDLADNTTKVLVTNLDDKDLSEDILVRLAKRKLFQLDAWQIVRNLFQAQEIDPRLTRHRWIADVLMESFPQGGYPAAPGAYLDAEIAWPILLRHVIGFEMDRPDLNSILRWSKDSNAVARYRAATREFRDAACLWLSEVAGPAVHTVLSSIESSERPDALPIGLALGVVYNSKGAGRLEKAAGKMEDRFLGRVSPDERTVERWSSAATEVIRIQITDSRDKRTILERADEILKDIGADAYAYLSSTSPLGFDQRLGSFGKALIGILESNRYDAMESLLEARAEIGDHEYANRDRSRLDCLDMAIRLVRWLGTLSDRGPDEADSLIEAVHYQNHEGSFVDWARLLLLRGDSVRALSESYAKLFERVTAIREKQARLFAEGLKRWTESDHISDAFIPVERVIGDVVCPLANVAPVLLIIMDGMSGAVCRELLPQIIGHEWVPLNREGRTGQVAPGLAAIPSITEVSRSSLLCGTLKQGGSSDEQLGFSSHPDLKAVCRGGQGPVVFHKPTLRGDDDAVLAGEVRAEIGSANRRVVGVVINAVDDLLSKGEQLGHRWTRESMPVLTALLHEAKLSRRLVIITSDHGHVIDTNSRYFKHEGGERWRTAADAPADYELRVSGRRVVIPESKTLIAPWAEPIRYGVKKYGYHGGINPQEMVTPIVVLSPSDQPIEGWVDAPSDLPSWWEEMPMPPAPVAETVAAVRPPPKPRKQDKNLSLFDLPEATEPSMPTPVPVRSAQPMWVSQLFESSLFEQQKKLAGRAVPSDEVLKAILNALEARGGKLTSAAISRAVNFPSSRIRGLLAVLQRVFNIDGFAVLSRDEASDTIELNRDLLKRQFDLD